MHVNHASHALLKIQYVHAAITLRIWVSKSGVLTNLFILSKHGTKANIRSIKMANNRHAYNRDVLQSYWTSDGLPLCCSQPIGEKTHTNQQCERHFESEMTILSCFLNCEGQYLKWTYFTAIL
jgi:hypothetical protein